MTLVDFLTPKDTEEFKPGLFIQKKASGEYRQIYPAAWNGKINWKNAILGKDFWKSFLWFIILMYLVWSYRHDIGAYKNFYEEVSTNPAAFCTNINTIESGGQVPLNLSFTKEDGEENNNTRLINREV